MGSITYNSASATWRCVCSPRWRMKLSRSCDRATLAIPPEPLPACLINSRTDIAIASGADGVHLRSHDIAASEARVIWEKSRFAVSSGEGNVRRRFLIAVSCHTAAEVRLAEGHGADFAVFAPVFEKVAQPRHEGAGLQALSSACRGEPTPANVEGVATGRMPVLALGGITVENARRCIVAGAAGVAGIRLFQENSVADVVRQLREQTLQRTAGQPFTQRP